MTFRMLISIFDLCHPLFIIIRVWTYVNTRVFTNGLQNVGFQFRGQVKFDIVVVMSLLNEELSGIGAY